MGGELAWAGAGAWRPRGVCVDWLSNNLPFQCGVSEVGENSWSLVDCQMALVPGVLKCHQLP